MQPHYSQSSRENATPSSGTSPVASYKEVPPGICLDRCTDIPNKKVYDWPGAAYHTRLFALDFFEAIVDQWTFGLINYLLVEISSS